MRGELFPEFSEELTEYIETHNIDENENLTEDYVQLKKHYSIVLEYVKELERKIIRHKETIRTLNSTIRYKEKQEIEGNVVLDKSIASELKSLKTTIGGLKSTNSKYKSKIAKLEEIIVDKEKELIELRGFRDKTIRLLNEKRD